MDAATLASPARFGLCLDCNYPLAGLPGRRCPECGRAFDPDDAGTFNPGRSIPPYAAWAVGPIGWPATVVGLGGAGVMLWRSRLPAIDLGWRSPQVLGWLVLSAIWLGWPLLRRAVLWHYRWPAGVIRPTRWRSLLVAPLMLAMVGIVAEQLPQRWAFDLSRPSFDALAAEVMHHPTQKQENRRAGLYWAKNIHKLPGGMQFTVEDDDVQFTAGFIYLPRLDPRQKSLHYRYLGHGWWAWRQEG